MTLIASLSAAGFVALVAWAVMSDLHDYRIPNAVSLGLVALFIATAAVADLPWRGHLIAGALAFALGLAAYRYDLLGGGDVKLIAAAALWAGTDWLVFVATLSFATAAFTGILLMARRALQALAADGVELDRVPRVLQADGHVPLAVPIAAAALVTFVRIPALGVL